MVAKILTLDEQLNSILSSVRARVSAQDQPSVTAILAAIERDLNMASDQLTALVTEVAAFKDQVKVATAAIAAQSGDQATIADLTKQLAAARVDLAAALKPS